MMPRSDGRPLPLSYHEPGTETPVPRRAAVLRRVVVSMAWAWTLGILAVLLPDFTDAPPAKKVALTASAAIILVLLAATSHRRRYGCAAWFALLALVLLLFLWD